MDRSILNVAPNDLIIDDPNKAREIIMRLLARVDELSDLKISALEDEVNFLKEIINMFQR